MPKSVVLALWVFLPLALRAQSGAPRWVLSAISAKGDTFYVDLGTVAGSVGERAAWVEIRIAAPDTTREGKWGDRQLSYVRFRCDEPKSAVEATFVYSGQTLVKTTDIPNPSYTTHPPGSIWEGIARAVCNHSLK